MSEKLILRLSSQSNSSVPWLVWSQTTKEVIASGELPSQVELDQLSEYSKGRAVTVLVDSADVRLYRHLMPTKPSRQMLKALPYMLEDELAEDIEQLHFATGESGYDKEQSQYWVDLAIVNKTLVGNWLTALAEAGIQCKTMLPEILCLPREDKVDFTALQLGANWLIREAKWQGSSLDPSWLEMYWQRVLATRQQTETPEVKVAALSALPEQVASLLVQSEQVEFMPVEPEMAMLVLAQEAESVKWNLLQGELAPKKTVSANWLIWRPVAALLAVLLVINFVNSVITWQSNKAELAKAQQALSSNYKQAFPKERFRATTLRRVLKRKVAEATGNTGAEYDFLAMMQKITPVFSQHKKTKLESVRFDGNRQELRLALSAASFQNFEQFKLSIEALGFSVQQGAVNNEGGSVTGSLSVRGQG